MPGGVGLHFTLKGKSAAVGCTGTGRRHGVTLKRNAFYLSELSFGESFEALGTTCWHVRQDSLKDHGNVANHVERDGWLGARHGLRAQ